MKLVTFIYQNEERLGALTNDQKFIYPIVQDGKEPMLAFIKSNGAARLSAIREAMERETEKWISGEEVQLLSPIPHPRDILCIGFNYQDHAKKAAAGRGEVYKKNEEPIYFYKRNFEATGDGAPIPYAPGRAETIGRGVEVVAVIGKDALNVPVKRVGEYIFGYSIMNDVCDTLVNRRYGQPMLVKSLDGYSPIGPSITTPDEFDGLGHIWRSTLTINDQLRADSTSDYMCFDIAYIVSQLSTCMTLPAGTMIATGSPGESEVDGKYRPVPGDTITCWIEGLGSLTQPVTLEEENGFYSDKVM